MANVERINYLIEKRDNIKNQIDNFGTYADSLIDQPTNGIELQIRLQQIVALFSEFDNTIDELGALDSTTKNSDERYSVQNKYFSVSSKAQTYLLEILSSQQSLSAQSQQSTSGSQNTLNTENRNKLKLPPASLSTFKGDYEQWSSFKNKFQTFIESRTELQNLEKYQYLLTSVKDEALRKIDNLEIDDSIYERA